MIVGAGQVGRYLCEKFSAEGEEVVLIDRDEQKVRRLERDLNIMGVVGSGASARILAEAGIARTNLFIAVTDSDEVNLMSCIMSKNYDLDKRIARVRNEDYLTLGHPLNEEALGIDMIISPDWAMAEEILQLCQVSEAVDVSEFVGGQVLLLGYRVRSDNPCAGRTLVDIKKMHGSHNFVMVAIVRNGSTIIPGGRDRILIGDTMYLTVRKNDLAAVEAIFGLASRSLELVFIIGGGTTGYMVARQLEENGISVRIVEQDEKRCEFLTENLSSTLVLNLDGLESHDLLEEGIDQADQVIAVTDSDTTNILASLLAKHYGARKCIARINSPDFMPLLGKLGIDATLSPRQVAANMILHFVRRGTVVSVATIMGGNAEVIEIVVPESDRFRKVPLKEVDFPRGAVVGAVFRDDRIFIPTGDTIMDPGDTLVIFFTNKARKAVASFFEA